MTTVRRDGLEPSPFHAWVRGHPDLDSIRQCLCIGDSDLWVQRYGRRITRLGTNRDAQYLMLVEVKVHGRDMDAPQRDLLAIVNDLLRTNAWKEQRANGRFVSGHAQNERSVHSYIAGKRVRVYCYGVHKLRLSGPSPELSEWMTWSDGGGTERYVSQRDLVSILRFDTNPDSLRPMEHREHKRRVQPEPALFEVCEICGQPGADTPVEHKGRPDGWVHQTCASPGEMS
jgi:hypothetical protein